MASPLIGAPATWLTLTAAGLAMGMMIFLMASGLTIVFGLMDVINFGHGAFIAVGRVRRRLGARRSSRAGPRRRRVVFNLAALAAALLVAMVATGALGLAVRTRDRAAGLRLPPQADPGDHGRADHRPAADPRDLGSRCHHLVAAADAEGFGGGRRRADRDLPHPGRGRSASPSSSPCGWCSARTKIGLLVRAGVENGEMVEALGYRIRRLFVAVFVAGSALAGVGGVMWGLYQETITAHMGSEIMILVFIVVIIGGLGSIEGCFIGALLVGLMANYTAFLAPKVALISNIGLMVLVLMWRPQGLYAVVKAK